MKTLAIHGGTPVRQAPFASWPPVTPGAVDAVREVLTGGVWSDVDGPRKTRFEREFARFQHAAHAVAVSNGTVSLQIALAAIGLHSGEEVIVPAYTFIATATAVLAAGGVPVFVDVSPRTATMDPDAVAAAITPRTRALMPVHFGGHPADLDVLGELARKHGLAVIEDAAQAHGARWRDRAVGSASAFGSFSFQESKNMTAGEGGALTTNDAELAEAAWSLHHCGRRPGGPWYEHERNGGNHRMTELQAALLLEQLAGAGPRMERRERNADLLASALAGVPGLEPLYRDPRCTRHAYHLFAFRYDPDEFRGADREVFLAAMRAEGIPVNGGYNRPVPQQPVFAKRAFDAGALGRAAHDPALDYSTVDTPVSDRLCRDLVWLPQTVLLAEADEVLAVSRAAAKVWANAGALGR